MFFKQHVDHVLSKGRGPGKNKYFYLNLILLTSHACFVREFENKMFYFISFGLIGLIGLCTGDNPVSYPCTHKHSSPYQV